MNEILEVECAVMRLKPGEIFVVRRKMSGNQEIVIEKDQIHHYKCPFCNGWIVMGVQMFVDEGENIKYKERRRRPMPTIELTYQELKEECGRLIGRIEEYRVAFGGRVRENCILNKEIEELKKAISELNEVTEKETKPTTHHAEKCPLCRGTGEISAIYSAPKTMVIKCNGCDGKGWVVVEDKPTQIFPKTSSGLSGEDCLRAEIGLIKDKQRVILEETRKEIFRIDKELEELKGMRRDELIEITNEMRNLKPGEQFSVRRRRFGEQEIYIQRYCPEPSVDADFVDVRKLQPGKCIVIERDKLDEQGIFIVNNIKSYVVG